MSSALRRRLNRSSPPVATWRGMSLLPMLLALMLCVGSCPVIAQDAAPARGAGAIGAQTRSREFLQGRKLAGGESAAPALQQARLQHRAILAERNAQPRAANLTAAWTAVGPAQVASPTFGNVTGRVSAIAVDPADASGNTIYLGTTGGGVWKSTDAAGPAAAVSFTPLTDTLAVFDLSAGSSATPSLSIGAVAVGGGVVLAGTGDPNDATDSYYGGGILRSADGGLTWTLATGSQDGVYGNHSFVGLSVSGLAFSTVNAQVVVAALSSSAGGQFVNAGSARYAVQGLYVSGDGGLTWSEATLLDGSAVMQSAASSGNGNAATAVVWNAARQMFFAAVRHHGYYGSADGMTWTRLANQPGTGLTQAACPTVTSSAGCPLQRGVLAVQPVSGDTFALTVSQANADEGLYQDVCGLTSDGGCANTVGFGSQLNSVPLEVGSGSTEIPQADYDLALAAAPTATGTLLLVGTEDIYACTLTAGGAAAGCVLRDTTNALNGCATPAGVEAAQHAIATLTANGGAPLALFGNDGGIWRSTDGVAETGGVCSPGDASHFENLNGGLGSLAEVVSFAQDPVATGTLLAGLGALGSAATANGTSVWAQMSTGEGGTVAIDPADPMNWYVSTGAGINIARCTRGSACGLADFAQTGIGAVQVDDDEAEIHAPWLPDPQAADEILLGTCRAWRGPASGGSAWTGGDLLSAPFADPGASACGSFPVVRSLAAGGMPSAAEVPPGGGSTVVYAGMGGTEFPGAGVFGHVFTTTMAQSSGGTTAWADAGQSPVTNSPDGFNPGQFDVSSITVDAHDATGATVYATIMGFSGNGINAPHVYRSADGGAHWTNISANLPNAPANSVIVDPNDANTVYVAMDTGVYVTTAVTTCPSANCWTVFGTGLPNAPAIELAAASQMATGDGRTGELRVGTYGRGIWAIPLLTATSPAEPAITLSPLSLAFADTQVQTVSIPETITVTNSGNATLTVTSVAYSGDFTDSDTCLGVSVAPNTSCTLTVRFAPTVAGPRTGGVTVYANIPGGQATASLTGVGTAPPAVVLTPLSLSFPATNVGAVGPVQNITLSNNGGATATLQSESVAGDFQISANTCGSTLTPGTGCTLSIAFAPTQSGVRNGTLTVTGNVGTQVAQLTGTGVSPATDALAPLGLSFAPQPLNTASTGKQVTLTNSGGVALTLISAQVTGDFTVTNGCGASLAANSACALTVTYVPKSLGAGSGILTVTDEFRSQQVSLTGVGTAPAGVSLSPSAGLTFAATPVGQSAMQQTVTLTNNGGVPLALRGVVSSGDFVVGTNTCGTGVGAGGSCIVQVGFSPGAAGVRTGSLTFTDDALNSPQVLPLSGTGVDFTLTADGPANVTVTSGQTATYVLLLSAAAGVPGSALFTCSGVPAAATCNVSPSPATLDTSGGTVVTVTVQTGQTSAGQSASRIGMGTQLAWLAMLLPFGFAMRRRRLLAASLACLTACVLLVGCSSTVRTIPVSSPAGTGGGNQVQTPIGSYTLVVAASSTGLVRAVDLTLVVQ